MKRLHLFLGLLFWILVSCDREDMRIFAIGEIFHKTELVNNILQIKGQVKITGAQYYEAGVVYGENPKPHRNSASEKIKRSYRSFDFSKNIALEWNKTYYITVYLKVGNKIRYQKVDKIVVPKKPQIILLSPTNNTKNIEYGLEIQWNAVKDATKYEIHFGKDRTNLKKLKEIPSSKNAVLKTHLNIYFRHNTAYFWQVKALVKKGNHNMTLESPIWNFRSRDFSKIIKSPSENAINIKEKPNLLWELSGAIHYNYDIYLAERGKPFTKIASDLSVKNYTLTDAQKLPLGKFYRWYITIKKGNVDLGNTDIYEFTTGRKSPKKLLVPYKTTHIFGYAVDRAGNQYVLHQRDSRRRSGAMLFKLNSNNNVKKVAHLDNIRLSNLFANKLLISKDNYLYLRIQNNSRSINSGIKYQGRELANAYAGKNRIFMKLDLDLNRIWHQYVPDSFSINRTNIRPNGDIIGIINFNSRTGKVRFEGEDYSGSGFILYKYNKDKTLVFKRSFYFTPTNYEIPQVDKDGNIYVAIRSTFSKHKMIIITKEKINRVLGIRGKQKMTFFKFDANGEYKEKFYLRDIDPINYGSLNFNTRQLLVDKDSNFYYFEDHDKDETISIEGRKYNIQRHQKTVAKYDSKGKLLFFKKLNIGREIRLKTEDTGFYLFGRARSFSLGSVGKNPKIDNATLIKFDENGNAVWAAQADATNNRFYRNNICYYLYKSGNKVYMINYSGGNTKIGTRPIRRGGYIWQVR